jgi:hypothetical protein
MEIQYGYGGQQQLIDAPPERIQHNQREMKKLAHWLWKMYRHFVGTFGSI